MHDITGTAVSIHIHFAVYENSDALFPSHSPEQLSEAKQYMPLKPDHGFLAQALITILHLRTKRTSIKACISFFGNIHPIITTSILCCPLPGWPRTCAI